MMLPQLQLSDISSRFDHTPRYPGRLRYTEDPVFGTNAFVFRHSRPTPLVQRAPTERRFSFRFGGGGRLRRCVRCPCCPPQTDRYRRTPSNQLPVDNNGVRTLTLRVAETSRFIPGECHLTGQINE